MDKMSDVAMMGKNQEDILIQYKTLVDAYNFLGNTSQFDTRDSVFFTHYVGEKKTERTYVQMQNTIRHLSLGLQEMGIKKGDRVGIMGPTSPQWMMFDYALVNLGAVSVPMFGNASEKVLDYQIKQTEIKYFLTTGVEQENKTVETVFSNNHIEVIEFKDEAQLSKLKKRIYVEDLMEKGKKREEQNPKQFLENQMQVQPEDLFTIVYTSGTTGQPKGVMLSHANICAQLPIMAERFPIQKDDVICAILPLAHIYQRTLSHYFWSTACPTVTTDPHNLSTAFALSKPTIAAVVPRLLEKIFDKLKMTFQSMTGIKRSLSLMAFYHAAFKSTAKAKTPLDWFYDFLIYRKIRQRLGGRIRCLVSGGAALGIQIERFLNNAGIKTYQGYGLTETSPIIASCYEGHNKEGTVGKLFQGWISKISEEGEILVKGPSLMMGYYKREEATKEAVVDGWFHTGDLGKIDQEGYLTISGRKKDMFKTSNGKYVAPVALEESISFNDLVGYSVVYGDAKDYVVCLIFPNYETLAASKAKRKVSEMSDEAFVDSDLFKKSIRKHIEKVNKKSPPWEKIRDFRIVKEELSIAKGDLTPKMNTKRTVLIEKYKSILLSMYPVDEFENKG